MSAVTFCCVVLYLCIYTEVYTKFICLKTERSSEGFSSLLVKLQMIYKLLSFTVPFYLTLFKLKETQHDGFQTPGGQQHALRSCLTLAVSICGFILFFKLLLLF